MLLETRKMVDLCSIRQFVHESCQDHRQLLSQLDEIKILIQSIKTEPQHVKKVQDTRRPVLEEINPIVGSISFLRQQPPAEPPVQLTRSVLIDNLE